MTKSYSAQARIETLLARQNDQQRKARTRTLIQVGSLATLSGLLATCDIEEGEDLQEDLNARDKAAILLGILSEANQLVQDLSNDPKQREKYYEDGVRLLKQSAAKAAYR